MENSDVKKILNVFFQKDYTEFYQDYDLDWKKNKWFQKWDIGLSKLLKLTI